MILWDYVSIAVVGVFVYPVVRFAQTGSWQYIYMVVGNLLADYATKIMKDVTRSSTIQVLKRPAAATNCDIFCRNGACGGRPGFPSGHMAITGFFVAYIFFMNEFNNAGLFLSFAITIVVLMAMARYYKSCHNLLQIVTGTTWGGFAAWAWQSLWPVLAASVPVVRKSFGTAS